jgi:orotate phosphoribosyltransferase
VTDCITVLDRQQGGSENIDKNGVKYHRCHSLTIFSQISLKSHSYRFTISSLITANDVLEILYEKNKITKDLMQATTEFLRVNNCIRDPSLKIKKDLKIYQV